MKKTWKNVRPLIDLGDHIGVTLSDGSIAHVDYADRQTVEGWNWSAIPSAITIYATRGGVKMHTAIFGKLRCDHIDGNGLNNLRANLRIATFTQNCQNRRLSSINSSGFKGVCFRKDRGTWLSSIRVDGKLIKIGTFSSKVDAAFAYDVYARKYFKEFAALNFPQGGEISAHFSGAA